MELADEITIPAPLDKVYEGLNDIAILKACIPGCEALSWTNENELEARVILKIGPVKAKFNGKVTLDTTNAPTGFSLAGAGDGGLAGFAKGGADVELIGDGDSTCSFIGHAPFFGQAFHAGAKKLIAWLRTHSPDCNQSRTNVFMFPSGKGGRFQQPIFQWPQTQ